jgi:hypothetical protein
MFFPLRLFERKCQALELQSSLRHFLSLSGGATGRAAEDKLIRYAQVLTTQQPPVAFQAFSFETVEGLHPHALRLLKRMQRYAPGYPNQPGREGKKTFTILQHQ